MRESRTFPNEAASVPAARGFIKSTLHGVDAETLQAIELMVSELATNCVRHTAESFEISVEHIPGQIRVQATDCGEGKPQMRSPAPTDPHGRGLRIIDALATDWGVEIGPGEKKQVWFELPGAAEPVKSLSGCR